MRREILDCSFSFNGSFQENCQQKASLMALVNMILEGANIKHQTQLDHTTTTKPGLATSQLMVFNSVSMHRKFTHQAQQVIAKAEKLHFQSTCPSRFMPLPKVGGLLTLCSIWDCVSHMTGFALDGFFCRFL